MLRGRGGSRGGRACPRTALVAALVVAVGLYACGRAKVPIRGRSGEAPAAPAAQAAPVAVPVPTPAVAETPGALPPSSSEVHDFGVVPVGALVHHVFTIDNPSDQPLKLKLDQKECGCTSAMIPGGIIAPGTSGWVELSLDTTRITGRGSWSVTLETGSASRPEIVLALQGTVVPDIAASPDRVFFGRLRRGEIVSKVVEVEVAEGVSTTRVSKDGPFRVRATRLGAPRRGIRLDVTLAAQGPSGPFDYEIKVETNSPRQPYIVIPVLGLVR
ncbi:MAG: DUF1573 domain-containing protein [Deltaproteobacteria bacterium]|nr:DUF1573 domain-containing protein [Deltaproteobacteria bacterium]